MFGGEGVTSDLRKSVLYLMTYQGNRGAVVHLFLVVSHDSIKGCVCPLVRPLVGP